MASFREQLNLAEAARLATAALEAQSRLQIEEIFRRWESGELTNQSVRYALENIVRTAYRTSASVAYSTSQANSGLPDWQPAVVFNNDYLQDLLQDVRRNLRDYKASVQGEVERRRAISRIEHSAGVAAQRGYTDQTISAYTELEDFGFELRKVWVANFVDNTPCPACVRLHGQSIRLHEMFQEQTGEPGVYRDLIGPPRHPRCQCKIVMLIKTLENAFENLDLEQPQETPQTMTTDQVKKLPRGIFAAIKAVLKAIAGMFRRS